jgi:hypothetical protein
MKVSFDERAGATEPGACDPLALDRALDELATFDPRLGQIVERRFLGWTVRARGRRSDGALAVHGDARLAHRALVAVPTPEGAGPEGAD